MKPESQKKPWGHLPQVQLFLELFQVFYLPYINVIGILHKVGFLISALGPFNHKQEQLK